VLAGNWYDSSLVVHAAGGVCLNKNQIGSYQKDVIRRGLVIKRAVSVQPK